MRRRLRKSDAVATRPVPTGVIGALARFWRRPDDGRSARLGEIRRDAITQVEVEAVQSGRARISNACGALDLRLTQPDQGTQILVIRMEGRINEDLLKLLLMRLREDPALDPRLPTLWDMRGHDFSQYGSTEIRGRAFLLSRHPERAGVRRAYLVTDAGAYGMMRMFQQTASGFEVEEQDNLRVSYDCDELMGWLQG